MAIPSIGVIITKIQHWFSGATYATKITDLKKVLEDDFDLATEKAHAALDVGIAEVQTLAKKELATVEAMVQSAARRAQALIAHDILHTEDEQRATAVTVAGDAHQAALASAPKV